MLIQFLLGSFLAVTSLLAASESEIIKKLQSDVPGIRKVAAEEARSMPPTEPLIKALIQAARADDLDGDDVENLLSMFDMGSKPSSIFINARDAAFRALVDIGHDSTIAGEFFSDFSFTDSRIGPEFFSRASPRVVEFMLKTILESGDINRIAAVGAALGYANRLTEKNAQNLLNTLGKNLPEIDPKELFSEKWQAYVEASSSLSQSGAKDTATANKILKYFKDLQFPIDRSTEEFLKELMTTLYDIAPKHPETIPTLQALGRKAAAAKQFRARAEILAQIEFIQTGKFVDTRMLKAREDLDGILNQLRTPHQAIPIPAKIIAAQLKKIEDEEERQGYLKKLTTKMLKSKDRSWKKIAYDLVYLLWDDKTPAYRPDLEASKTCRYILKQLNQKGLIHRPEPDKK